MSLARKLLWAGAGLTVLSLSVTLATTEQLADALREDNPLRSEASIDAAVEQVRGQAIFRAIVGTSLWVWMAVKNGDGRKWARVTGTIFGIINLLATVFVALLLLSSDTSANDYVVSALVLWAVGTVLAITLLVLLWKPESSRFYEEAERWRAAMMLRGYG